MVLKPLLLAAFAAPAVLGNPVKRACVSKATSSSAVVASATSVAPASSSAVVASSSTVAAAQSASTGISGEGQSSTVLSNVTIAESLNDLAKAKGKLYFGTAIDNGGVENPTYMSIAQNTSIMGQITPGNAQKWDTIEATQGVFSYTKADAIVDPAVALNQTVRCHNLVWYNQVPSWLTNGGFDNATLIGILENHIKNVMEYYADDCYAWDVVNEAISDSDGAYRSSVWYDTIGPEYIPIAFKFANQYNKGGAKLYYNDYSIEQTGTKNTAVANIVKGLQARNISIDGVGLQSHFIAGSSPTYNQQVAAMKVFTDLGLEVAITELDVRITLPDDTTKLASQASDYANAVQACVDTEACVGITVWDFYDPYSWVPSTFSGSGDACLFFANYTTHPAYDSIVKVLSA